jgi:hypothetical protein
MENLAGNPKCDEEIRSELTRARIPIVENIPARGEVPSTLQGKLGPITFTRAWVYWVAAGPVPLEIARELFADPVGREDVRSGGHCGCPAPDTFGATYYDADGLQLYSDPDGVEQQKFEDMVARGVLKREHMPGRFVRDKRTAAVRAEVTVYHIDTEVGLRLFADAIRECYDYEVVSVERPRSLDFPQDCYLTRFELGYDVDSTPHQYKHICHTYPSGALCGTKLLWFHAGALTTDNFTTVDCPVCVHLWERRGLAL